MIVRWWGYWGILPLGRWARSVLGLSGPRGGFIFKGLSVRWYFDEFRCPLSWRTPMEVILRGRAYIL